MTYGPLLDRYLNETLQNNPLAYYRMREGSGTTMLDYGSHSLNGTYNGSGISWIASAASSAAGYAVANGKNVPIWNSHLTQINWNTNPVTTTNPSVPQFDGAAGRATSTLTGINTTAASSVTVEGWVNWDGNLAGSTGTFEAIFNFNGASGILLGFLKNGTADYRFGISVRNTGDLWGISNANTLAALTKGSFHHIVFVLVNNNIQASKLYIDGVQYTMTQQIGTSTTTDSVTTAFAIGYDGSVSFFGGLVAEVAVFNGEIFNAAAVLNRFNVGSYGGSYHEIPTMPGIESQVEFHPDSSRNAPIVMNTKDNGIGGQKALNTYCFDDIGGLDAPDMRFSEESNFYRDGTNPLTSHFGGRTLTFDGYIEATNFQVLRQLTTQMKGMNVPVASAITNNNNGITETPIVFRNVWDNGFDFLTNARLSAPIQMKESQDDLRVRRPFLITVRSSNPSFESVGSRTDVLSVGATLALPNKGNFFSYPSIVFYGPLSQARFVLNNTLLITMTLQASATYTVDCKNRIVSDWSKLDPAVSDFPYINPASDSDSFLNYAQFVSVSGFTAGVTRVEITWKHVMI